MIECQMKRAHTSNLVILKYFAYACEKVTAFESDIQTGNVRLLFYQAYIPQDFSNNIKIIKESFSE